MSLPVDTSLAVADWSGAIICATRCYACQFGEHPDVPHSWGSPDDFEHAWVTFQDAPGFCGCACGRPLRTVPKVRVRPALPSAIKLIAPWMYTWNCPHCAFGTAMNLAAAVTEATQHRKSDGCKYRKVVA